MARRSGLLAETCAGMRLQEHFRAHHSAQVFVGMRLIDSSRADVYRFVADKFLSVVSR